MSCRVTIAFDENICAIGLRSVARHLLRSLDHGAELPDAMLYGTAYALKTHWKQWKNSELFRTVNFIIHFRSFLQLIGFISRTIKETCAKQLFKLIIQSIRVDFMA